MIYILDKKDKMVGILTNDTPLSCPYFEDNHVENIETGVHYYTFSVPASHETAGKIEVEGSIIRADLDGKLNQFIIKNINEISNNAEYIKEVSAEHIAISELLTDIVRPTFLASTTLESAMNYVLQGTGYELGDFDYIGSEDLNIESHITVLEAIYQIGQLFNAEIQFETIFENGVIKKKLVHMQEQRGTVTKKLFAYSKDLVEVKRTEETVDLVTALIALGKTGENGQPLSLVNYEYERDGVFTEYANDFIESEESLQLYGKNGKHIFGVYVDSEADTKTKLFYNAKDELNIRRKPKFTFTCAVATLERITGYSGEKIRVGDTVNIQDHSFNPPILLEARILELTRSYVSPENDEVVLGDYRPIKLTTSLSIEKIQQMIKEREAEWEADTYKVQISSTTGIIFKNGVGSTTLNAEVFKSDELIDETGTQYSYVWSKYNSNGALIENYYTKTITVNSTDIFDKANFKVEVSLEDSFIGISEVTISNVFDGEKGDKGEKGDTGATGLQGLQGERGDRGIQGVAGDDGVSSYTHIAYANSSDGTIGFSVSDSVDKEYIGMYVDSSPNDSTNPSSYNWTLIKGADGSQGIQGKTGADGKTSYLHIAYANSSDGVTGFSTTDSTGKMFIGQYTDFISADSTLPSMYKWTLIKGDKGERGIQGIKGETGADGKSLYTWVKYADSSNGSGMSDYPTGKTFIGLAYNKTTPTESNVATDYQWALIQGSQGVKGESGQTYYTWIKYADDEVGNGLSDNPDGKRYLGIAYNKTTSTESTNKADYSWSPLYDNVEVGGRNLLLNSDFSKGTNVHWGSITGGLKTDGNINYITIVGTFGVRQSIYTEAGQMYTISALVRKASATDSKFMVKYNTDNADTPSITVDNTEWKRITTQRKATTTGLQTLYFHTRNEYPIDIALIKIEKGNIATDYTKAPEDMEEEINDVNKKINNAVTTIDGTGVTVTDGSFFLKDSITGDKYSLDVSTNLIKDHSFELVQPLNPSTTHASLFTANLTTEDAWNKWGKTGEPYVATVRGTDLASNHLMFGYTQMVVNNANYVFQYANVDGIRPYTISYYATMPMTESGMTVSVKPRVIIDFYNSSGTNIGNTSNTFTNIVSATKQRYSYSFTTPNDCQYIRVKVLGDSVSGWIEVDGIQLVKGNNAIAYDSEDSLWETLLGGLKAIHLESDTFSANAIYTDGMDATTLHTESIRIVSGIHSREIIKPYGTPESHGIGLVFGGGGRVIVGAGESADEIASANTTGTTENLELSADGVVTIYTNVNGGYAGRKTTTFQTSGNVDFSGDIRADTSMVIVGGLNFNTGSGSIQYYKEGSLWCGNGYGGMGMYIRTSSGWVAWKTW